MANSQKMQVDYSDFLNRSTYNSSFGSTASEESTSYLIKNEGNSISDLPGSSIAFSFLLSFLIIMFFFLVYSILDRKITHDKRNKEEKADHASENK